MVTKPEIKIQNGVLEPRIAFILAFRMIPATPCFPYWSPTPLSS